MKVIYNKIIPFGKYDAINLFGILFINTNNYPYSTVTKYLYVHETIHTKQMKEMLYIFFYLWYCIEWIIRLIIYRDTDKAYRTICFEQEAYANEDIEDYLNIRKHYSWIKYLF